MTFRSRMHGRLAYRIGKELKKQGHPVDRYDPDFIVGVVMEWLEENNCALTGGGVRRFKK